MNDYPVDILYDSGELLIEKFCGGRKITFVIFQGRRVVDRVVGKVVGSCV